MYEVHGQQNTYKIQGNNLKPCHSQFLKKIYFLSVLCLGGGMERGERVEGGV